MLIKYYNNEELSYSNRKRYSSEKLKNNYKPFAEEIQKAVYFGDGGQTSIKTSKSNICHYVEIDDTRWYVLNYVYLNGGQVQLNIQRDVVGENGLYNLTGKIERGITDSFIKNRKELGLNEILKKRVPLIPNSNRYGNFLVDNQKDEMWGILYFTRPTGIDPNTGKPFPEKLNINIPAFAPNYSTLPLIDDGEERYRQSSSDIFQSFSVAINFVDGINGYATIKFFDVKIEYSRTASGSFTFTKTFTETSETSNVRDEATFVFDFWNTTSSVLVSSTFCNIVLNKVADEIGKITVENPITGLEFPSFPDIIADDQDYTGKIVKDGTNFYEFSSEERVNKNTGNTSYNTFMDFVVNRFDNSEFDVYDVGGKLIKVKPVVYSLKLQKFNPIISSVSNIVVRKYTRRLLTLEESGNIQIDTTIQLVDEPFNILVCPLFNGKITNADDSTNFYNIQRSNAFMIFNTIIQYLSGENPYLIDAQIYPYCPDITDVQTNIGNFPFFKVQSSYFTRKSILSLDAFSDVKKEYICKSYRIQTPDQSGSFVFNFYDYVNRFNDDNGINKSEITFEIKCALKPFGVVDACIIIPDSNSIKGITYSSDLRGANPTGSGYQASLSSNAYESYKRSNSYYQQIFRSNQEELEERHRVEKINDITGAVINTITGTAMGAIGGAAMADFTVMGNNAKGTGAIIGGAVAGTALGIANGIQATANEKFRGTERRLQQERFDFEIGTIKNLPNSVNRISSYNEIIMQDFKFIIEIYECSQIELEIAEQYINEFSYEIGIISNVYNFYRNGRFIRSTLIKSNLTPILHDIMERELMGGIYYNE